MRLTNDISLPAIKCRKFQTFFLLQFHSLGRLQYVKDWQTRLTASERQRIVDCANRYEWTSSVPATFIRKIPFQRIFILMCHIYCRRLSTQLSFIAFSTPSNVNEYPRRCELWAGSIRRFNKFLLNSISLPRSIIEFMNFIKAISEGFIQSNSIYDHSYWILENKIQTQLSEKRNTKFSSMFFFLLLFSYFFLHNRLKYIYIFFYSRGERKFFFFGFIAIDMSSGFWNKLFPCHSYTAVSWHSFSVNIYRSFSFLSGKRVFSG